MGLISLCILLEELFVLIVEDLEQTIQMMYMIVLFVKVKGILQNNNKLLLVLYKMFRQNVIDVKEKEKQIKVNVMYVLEKELQMGKIKYHYTQKKVYSMDIQLDMITLGMTMMVWVHLMLYFKQFKFPTKFSKEKGIIYIQNQQQHQKKHYQGLKRKQSIQMDIMLKLTNKQQLNLGKSKNSLMKVCLNINIHHNTGIYLLNIKFNFLKALLKNNQHYGSNFSLCDYEIVSFKNQNVQQNKQIKIIKGKQQRFNDIYKYFIQLLYNLLQLLKFYNIFYNIQSFFKFKFNIFQVLFKNIQDHLTMVAIPRSIIHSQTCQFPLIYIPLAFIICLFQTFSPQQLFYFFKSRLIHLLFIIIKSLNFSCRILIFINFQFILQFFQNFGVQGFQVFQVFFKI